jgi:hypothetical protein
MMRSVFANELRNDSRRLSTIPGPVRESFLSELYQRTGRQTVPYLIDPILSQSFSKVTKSNTYLKTYGLRLILIAKLCIFSVLSHLHIRLGCCLAKDAGSSTTSNALAWTTK